MSDDRLVTQGEEEQRRSAAARLFDVRRVIGGLFVLYGVLVGAAGLFDSSKEIDKAQGVRINLWAGLGMLALGALFLLWQWIRPAEPPESDRTTEVREED
jgi:cell division septal protein FtsQ